MRIRLIMLCKCDMAVSVLLLLLTLAASVASAAIVAAVDSVRVLRLAFSAGSTLCVSFRALVCTL